MAFPTSVLASLSFQLVAFISCLHDSSYCTSTTFHSSLVCVSLKLFHLQSLSFVSLSLSSFMRKSFFRIWKYYSKDKRCHCAMMSCVNTVISSCRLQNEREDRLERKRFVAKFFQTCNTKRNRQHSSGQNYINVSVIKCTKFTRIRHVHLIVWLELSTRVSGFAASI